jgi:hypothetical protein
VRATRPIGEKISQILNFLFLLFENSAQPSQKIIKKTKKVTKSNVFFVYKTRRNSTLAGSPKIRTQTDVGLSCFTPPWPKDFFANNPLAGVLKG